MSVDLPPGEGGAEGRRAREGPPGEGGAGGRRVPPRLRMNALQVFAGSFVCAARDTIS